MNPGSAIPNYPARRADVPSAGVRARRSQVGYRFDLTVEDPVPATEGCAAAGSGGSPMSRAGGRHAPSPVAGVRTASVHAARGRPGHPDDPAVR
jgi:hypothetical protein